MRDWIVPVNRRYPLQQLMGALRSLFPSPLRRSSNSSDSHSDASSHAGSGQAAQATAAAATEAGQSAGSSTGGAEAESGRWLPPPALLSPEVPPAHAHVSSTAAAVTASSEGGSQSDRHPAGSSNGSGSGGGHATLLIEYTMLRGINDTKEDAHRLLQLLDGIAAKVSEYPTQLFFLEAAWLPRWMSLQA